MFGFCCLPDAVFREVTEGSEKRVLLLAVESATEEPEESTEKRGWVDIVSGRVDVGS
jgi:hypothetical protein